MQVVHTDNVFGIVLKEKSQSFSLGPAESYLNSLSSKLSRRTMASYLKRIAAILNHDPLSCPWHKLTKDFVFHVLDTLKEEGKAPGTVGSYLSAIKGVCYFAFDKGLMSAEEYTRIKAIKRPKGSRLKNSGVCLSNDDVQDLIDECNSDNNKTKGIRDEAIITTLRGCGLRRSEVINAKVDSVDLDENKITIIGKNNKEREVWFSGKVAAALTRWITFRKKNDSGFHQASPLFVGTHKTGKFLKDGICPQTIFDMLMARRHALKMKKFAPHDFRRTYITSLLDEGFSLEDVQALAGHESSETTKLYDLNQKRHLKKIGSSISF